jgi:HSP20 family protein
MEAHASKEEVSLMSAQKLADHDSSAELSDWAGSPLSTLHPQPAAGHPIPYEECAERNRYVARFDLPGLDPESDLEVSVGEHVLTVRAERPPEAPATHESGFAHGTLRSTITLPAETDDRDVAAVYRNGILEVNIGWQHGPTTRTIKVLHLSDAW